MYNIIGLNLGLRRIELSISIPGLKWLRGNFRYHKDRKLTENKRFEIQIETDWDVLFEISFRASRKEDHAGAAISLGLLNRWISFNIYDKRHWNDDKDRWKTLDDHDEMMLTAEQAADMVSEVVDDIIKDPTKIDKALRKLKYDELNLAVISRLAEMQYTTLAKTVGDNAFGSVLKKAWWIKRDFPIKKGHNHDEM